MMTKQTINIGQTANDRKGDSLRTAFLKINDNFDELYTSTESITTPLELDGGGASTVFNQSDINIDGGTASTTFEQTLGGSEVQ